MYLFTARTRRHRPSPDGGGLAQAWFESMASLAWRLATLAKVGGRASLFSSLLMEGRSVGVIDRQFSLDFSKKSPAFSRMKPSYAPVERDELRLRDGRLAVSGGGALVRQTAWDAPVGVDLEDTVNERSHACP